MTNKTMTTSELKPCPFCESSKELTVFGFDGKAGVQCNNCKSNGPFIKATPGELEPIIKAWNTRSTAQLDLVLSEAEENGWRGVECCDDKALFVPLDILKQIIEKVKNG